MNNYVRNYAIASLVLVSAACGRGEPVVAPGSSDPTPATSSVASRELAPMTEYATSLDGMPRGGNCALDAINGNPTANADITIGQDVVFGGWMADGSGQVPASARLVLSSVSGNYSVPVVGGGERADVAESLGMPALVTSGYDFATKMTVTPGVFDLFIVHGEVDPVACPLNVQLKVR